jgi:hypothetical protein
MHRTLGIIGAAFAAAMTVATAAEAATCKAIINAAIAKWRVKARENYGIVYRFWSRADNRVERCTCTPSVVTCMVSAKPCSLI